MRRHQMIPAEADGPQPTPRLPPFLRSVLLGMVWEMWWISFASAIMTIGYHYPSVGYTAARKWIDRIPSQIQLFISNYGPFSLFVVSVLLGGVLAHLKFKLIAYFFTLCDRMGICSGKTKSEDSLLLANHQNPLWSERLDEPIEPTHPAVKRLLSSLILGLLAVCEDGIVILTAWMLTLTQGYIIASSAPVVYKMQLVRAAVIWTITWFLAVEALTVSSGIARLIESLEVYSSEKKKSLDVENRGGRCERLELCSLCGHAFLPGDILISSPCEQEDEVCCADHHPFHDTCFLRDWEDDQCPAPSCRRNLILTPADIESKLLAMGFFLLFLGSYRIPRLWTLVQSKWRKT